MSTLVTSVTPLQISQSATVRNNSATTATDAPADNADAGAARAPSTETEQTALRLGGATVMGLSPHQLQQSAQQQKSLQQPQQQQQQLVQHLLPSQMAVNYANGAAAAVAAVGFPPSYANYARNLQAQQQQQQQQQQLHNTFNMAAFQQQQHQHQQQQQQLGGMPNPNIAYHHAQQAYFAQLQTPSQAAQQQQQQQQQQRCAITPTSIAAQSSSSLLSGGGGSSSHPNSLPMSAAVTNVNAPASSNSINRSQRCGVCRGCVCKPCGVCTYCQDSPQFGGRGVKKQSCIERRCLRVLENRLQRDAPTFKARMGCNNCDDCRMPDCQVCLVCLDRRFFNNRYMSGAICAKKRCNNAVSIELSPQAASLHNNNDLPPSNDRNQIHLKRSYDNNLYEPMSAKRRGIDTTGVKSSPKSVTPPSSNSSQHGKNVTSPNGLIADISPQRQHLIQQQMLAQQFRNIKGDQLDMGGALSLEAYRSATAVTTNASGGGDAIAAAAGLGTGGNYYLGSSGYFPNNAALNGNTSALAPFDASSAAAVSSAVPPTAAAAATANSLVYQQYQQQQQHLQTQLFCNTYLQQQQKFANYPKYEYYDEHAAYGAAMQNAMLQNATNAPPADPFVPPSYSEMKNVVVLQPL